MARKFCKCPTWWVRDEENNLSNFLGGKSSGVGIAALKCVLALSSSIDFWTRKAKLSLSEIEKLTGLSRPMVIKGLARLVEANMVLVDKMSHVHEYELTEKKGDAYWAKIPFDRIRKHLPEISNRGEVYLVALKIYLVLTSIRPNESPSVAIGYEKIRDYVGCQRSKIRPALDVLYSHTLIRITHSDESKERHNVYTILGL
ncbi:replication protein [Pseudomonas syringae]|uniref:replication protein n=1 Tax=Pseudomonas syringae TaxID=317 RepID=UPI001786E2C5|nr:replication protein [Pseudomonas syringae]